ncbi:glycosyltransferase family 1 protein [Parachaetomium inaequale]|uniref:Glycosyltransferase family 1 protein n=1 Tax=Parachaetomium inaequale TaxID=2588326 RepID=A0AAN6P734_9PEZI|nr:glycosyltransferase family 1 protein [Parachaetomium inaequale]
MRQLVRFSSAIALLAVVLGAFRLWAADRKPAELGTPVRGRNERSILFFTLAEAGQINVQLATAQALLEKHPDLVVHFASFPSMRQKVSHVSSLALKRTPSTQALVFHELPGPDRMVAMTRQMNGTGPLECLAHPPGARGAALLAEQLELALWPWSGEEHMAIYQRCLEVVEDVDPGLVVVDFAFRPAMDAVEQLNRHRAVISPLAMADIFATQQRYGAGLWKYPAWGTGFSFPVPWHQIPENVYVNLRLLYNLLANPQTKAAVKYLRDRGIGSHPLSFPKGVPFITQTLPGASIPVGFVPDGVSCAGAIVLDSAPAEEQDAELAAWVQRAPTIIVNLGSLFKYTPERATLMAEAIQRVLAANSEVQVLWKMARNTDVVDETFSETLAKHLSQDRVRIMDWLTVDMLPLLQLDKVVASVHHGGSSSFNEAVAAGVPQVVMPIWEDHYNFAQLVEDLGLGLYATRGTAPEWTVAGIAEPILRVVKQGEESRRWRKKAEEIGRLAQERPGRYVAAAELVRLLGV